MSDDDINIDFDGDGERDDYDTEHLDDGTTAYVHHDEDGDVDAIAYDTDNDGYIDSMDTDEDGDGVVDHHLTDTTGDGVMDTDEEIDAPSHDTGGDNDTPPVDHNPPADDGSHGGGGMGGSFDTESAPSSNDSGTGYIDNPAR